MWTVYGAGGCAISTTIGKLKAILAKTDRDFAIAPMRYVKVSSGNTTDLNWESERDKRLLLQPHFLKRWEYESENEVRLITSGPEGLPHKGILLREINPTEWLSEVRLWPALNPSEAGALGKAITALSPGVSVAKSDLLAVDPDEDQLLQAFSEMDLEIWQSDSDEIPPAMKEVS
jgi:hypothetical protein